MKDHAGASSVPIVHQSISLAEFQRLDIICLLPKHWICDQPTDGPRGYVTLM